MSNGSSHAPRWFLEAINTPYSRGSVEVEGCPVNYLEWGDTRKPGVVLIHGGAAHAHWWAFIAPQLARAYHVVALDLSGHGDSGKRDAYPRELWCDEIMAVAADAGIVGAPVLVGHSMGGFVCMNTAVQYGDRLAGAVIVDSPVKRPDPESEEGARGKAFRNPKTYPSREEARAHYRLVPDQPCSNGFIIDYIAEHSMAETERGVTWKFDPMIFHNLKPRSPHEILPKVRCRVAVIRAEYGLVDPETGDYMYELLGRNAPVIEIPDAYHHIMLDQPIAMITALRALLADWEHSVPRKARPATT
jgi:pimeloyl-ACP methyl ester carboxylesterase